MSAYRGLPPSGSQQNVAPSTPGNVQPNFEGASSNGRQPSASRALNSTEIRARRDTGLSDLRDPMQDDTGVREGLKSVFPDQQPSVTPE